MTASALPPVGRHAILVVDDEETLRATLTRALTRAGFDVRVAANGAEALAIVEAGHDIDAVLTDLVMPVMDGRKLALTLRERVPHLPVLCMTGYADGLDDGPPDAPWAPTRIISKPFAISTVVERLKQTFNAA
jgi:two-component system cell cycle sensor histidine kinase/response regulator CckA